MVPYPRASRSSRLLALCGVPMVWVCLGGCGGEDAPGPTPGMTATPAPTVVEWPTPGASDGPDATPWVGVTATPGLGETPETETPGAGASPTPPGKSWATPSPSPGPAPSATPASSPTPVAATPVFTGLSVLVNPYESAPLAAVVKVARPGLEPADVRTITVTVHAIPDGAEDLTATLDVQSDAFRTNFDMSDLLDPGEVGIPVLGLYAGALNRVSFAVETAGERFEGEVDIETEPIQDLDGEIVTLEVLDADRMTPGWTYLDDRVYDSEGNLRWYGKSVLQVMQNGNILWKVKEKNWLGKTVRAWTLPSTMSWHHDSIELPGGNIVACVNNATNQVVTVDGETVASLSDYVVELDRDTGQVVNAWDFREFLDVNRQTVIANDTDWLHMNTVWYDGTTDTLIMSGRYQGIVKVTRGGIQGAGANAGKRLVWILAPHLDWGMAGWNGRGDIDPNDYLLTAVDSSGSPYPEEVQNNLAPPAPDRDDFHWPVGQHGLAIVPRDDGLLSLLVFDNQASFIFDGEGTVDNGVSWTAQGDLSNDRSLTPYSLIIEYVIDEDAMTVREAWSYGVDVPDLYGSHHCGVRYFADTGNRLMVSSGFDQHDQVDNPYNPVVLEFAPNGDLVFRLEIENTDFAAYRAGRIDLYHPGGPG